MNDRIQACAARVVFAASALLGASAGADAKLPKRLRIFKFGHNETNQGDFIVDDQTIANLSAIQRQLGRERVPIGFEHNIDEGSAEYNRTKEPRDVAAKASTVIGVPSGGIDLDDISWTPLAAPALDNYEDISATPIFDKVTRRVIGILSASFTRTGSTYGLTIENAAMAALSANLAGFEISPVEEQTLTGIDRTVAAFARQNKRHEENARATLSARRGAVELTGRERMIAAFDSENRSNPSYLAMLPKN